jgi:predicted RNA-binding Zn-ribbon protein involved in translation (DUF1610 family)
MRQATDEEVNCRSCGKTVLENSHRCPHCGIGAPGIHSRCPACRSTNYVYHKYGYAVLRGILATCVVGPLGPIFGFVGYNRAECVCLQCKQGWFPFMPEEQIGRFNTLIGEEGRMSRKFNSIPANCYDES